MKQQVVSAESFHILGIKTRTTNAEEMKGSGKIQALWGRFYSEQILNKIPNKLNNEILAVYHDYESDANGPYSLLIGVKVAANTSVPPHMDILKVPAQKYFHLATNAGEMPSVVIEAWKKVWEGTEKSEIKRKYSFDFELYTEKSMNPMAAEVDLFIAVD